MILTSQHVVDEAGPISVALSDGRRFRAVLIAADHRSDLAIIRVAAGGLPVARLGDTTRLRRGRLVLAFGNPFGLSGDGQAAASLGTITGVGRSLPEFFGREEDRYYGDMLQTNLLTRPGESGGPLFDVRGCVVGVMTAMGGLAGEGQGLGFAVPINDRTRAIIERLLKGEQIEYGDVGMQVGTPTEAQRQAAGLTGPGGAVVREVRADGPAARAGVRAGDILTVIDGRDVDGEDHFRQLVGEISPGCKVELTVLRQSRRLVISVELARREARSDEPVSSRKIEFRGATLGRIEPSMSEAGNLPPHAMIVLLVHEGSPADRAGLSPGDIIVQVQGKPATADTYRLLADSTGDVLLGLANSGSVLVKNK